MTRFASLCLFVFVAAATFASQPGVGRSHVAAAVFDVGADQQTMVVPQFRGELASVTVALDIDAMGAIFQRCLMPTGCPESCMDTTLRVFVVAQGPGFVVPISAFESHQNPDMAGGELHEAKLDAADKLLVVITDPKALAQWEGGGSVTIVVDSFSTFTVTQGCGQASMGATAFDGLVVAEVTYDPE